MEFLINDTAMSIRYTDLGKEIQNIFFLRDVTNPFHVVNFTHTKVKTTQVSGAHFLNAIWFHKQVGQLKSAEKARSDLKKT